MARKVIRLKYKATCADCGAALPVGAKARYYGRGKIYGTECHPQKGNGAAPQEDGREVDYVQTTCEDYPCCGHGPTPQGDGGGCPTVTFYKDGKTEERWRCASCGASMEPGASSSLCGGCRRAVDPMSDEAFDLAEAMSEDGGIR